LALTTRELLSGLARLTGDKGVYRRHNKVFRRKVTSSDGVECSLNLDACHHRDNASSANLNDIADRLHVDRDEVEKVIATWGPNELDAWCARFTADELKPPAYRPRSS
jgi:hypothetical protein